MHFSASRKSMKQVIRPSMTDQISTVSTILEIYIG